MDYTGDNYVSRNKYRDKLSVYSYLGIQGRVIYDIIVIFLFVCISLSDKQKDTLFHCVKDTLQDIYLAGGRNSETDLFGKKGGYIPTLSKDTVGKPCPVCGEDIRKENFLGGSIYYCFECQK